MENMKDKIAILIPTFNREHFLLESLMSIKLQTYTNLKAFIYDDGSTDDTEKIVSQFIKADSRFYYVRDKKNRGVVYARNILLNMCRFEGFKYAAWQDSDDKSNIYRLQYQYNAILHKNCAVVGTTWKSTNRMNDHDWNTAWLNFPEVADKTRICFAGILFNVANSVDFNENKVTGEDVNWRSLMKKKNGKEFCLNEILYYVRWHAGRLSHLKRKRK